MREKRDRWEPVVYRWPDGSVVRAFRANDRDVRMNLYLCSDDLPESVVHFAVFDSDAGDQVLTSWSDRHLPWLEDTERRVLGFALDLGAVRPDEERTALVSNHRSDESDVELAAYPRFVDDDRWAGRYDEALRLASLGLPADFLGVVRGFFVEEVDPSPEFRTNRRVFATWGKQGVVGSVEAPTLSETVDKVVRGALVLPESGRAAWEQERVLRGSFVLPSPDELEVFRALGEPLPFWWGNERFYAWLQERR